MTAWVGHSWPSAGRWRWLRLLFSVIWLVYLAEPLRTLSARGHSAWWLAAALSVTVAFCAVFVVVAVSRDRRPVLARLGLVALVPLAAAFSLLFGGHAAAGHVVWIYVSSAVGWAVCGRRAVTRAVAGVAACYLLFSWLGHAQASETLITLIPVVLVGVTMSGIRTQVKLAGELRQAREEVAMLAANEERLRLARDMHDLTGQSLSVITLKSELAARLLRRLPASEDRDRALAQAQEVAAVSRQTLRDIREAISGYRRPTLAVEAVTARTALASAGITVRDDPELIAASGTIDPDAEAALAWCLREAVTNVVRHSGARDCSISLTRRGGALSLQVRDDGHGYLPPGSVLPGSGPPREDGPLIPDGGSAPGTGLCGMSERLRAVGGALELNPAGAPGFCLVATVPATSAPPAAASAPPAAASAPPATASAQSAAGSARPAAPVPGQATVAE